MRLVWNQRKGQANLAKHKVSFDTARLVFDDPFAVSTQDRTVQGEERWQTIGLVGGVVALLVAHTYDEADGDEVIRIVSARKAMPRERRVYEENLQATGK